MRECDLGEGKILLIKDKGTFTAIGHKCSHYGAPLKSGAYCNGKVRCPWHGACFSTTTGDIEDFPGVGGVPRYDVRIDGENVVVSALVSQLQTSKATYNGVKTVTDSRVFVIIGAGAAGWSAAESLRAQGFAGRIVLVGAENNYAYDRPKLSKAMDINVEAIHLRPPSFYTEHNIETHLGVKCTELDPENKTVALSNGQTIKYDQALIATGADPQKLTFIPGHDGNNVYTLRNIEDANKIVKAVEGKEVVIVGSSFIGMEVAACIVKKAKSTTVIGMEAAPFARVLGAEVGGVLQKIHEAQGIKFQLNAIVSEMKKDDSGAVNSLVLKDGTVLNAEIVIIGAGVVPATSFIKQNSSVKLEKDKSVVVDKHLFTGADGLYAAGDIARFPYALLGGEHIRVEHYGFASTQGAHAAKNMLNGSPKFEFKNIPFFWTVQYGKSVRYAGHALSYDEIVLDVENQPLGVDSKFVAYYIHKGVVAAACSFMRDPMAAQIAEILGNGISIGVDELKSSLSSGSTSGLIAEKLKKAQH
eukprot:TRINITY_DN835_c0_g1_i1.p1 TRINITY_DN835_c0_g1~~TRINITY_DN835_c0_g1_i1.p1  ORF type:complete len:573 (-),score=114.42 TRINITY_DN835_c0_g1_i1:76-1662(-)